MIRTSLGAVTAALVGAVAHRHLDASAYRAGTPVVLWLLLGVLAIALVAGGIVYLRRRA